MFGHKKTIVGYVELRSDEVEFRNTDSSLMPGTAVFSVGSNSTDSNAVTLTVSH